MLGTMRLLCADAPISYPPRFSLWAPLSLGLHSLSLLLATVPTLC